MKGKAALDGASLVNRNFSITLELEREEDSDGPA